MAAEEARAYSSCLDDASIAGSDLLVSAFAAALAHYRRATLCLPFPTDLFTSPVTKDKDYEAAARALAALPSLRALAAKQQQQPELSVDAHDLLGWLLAPTSRRAMRLRHISLEEFQAQHEAHAGARLTLPAENTPTYVFQNLSASSSSSSSSAQGAVADSSGAMQPPRVLAFHGTLFERLHSIINTGLQPASGTRLQQNGAIYGAGIYMATDFGVAFNFCEAAPAWNRSALGSKLRALLVCQVEESGLRASGGPALPEHYLVVERPDAVSISHILVYCDEPSAAVEDHGAAAAAPQRGRFDWSVAVIVAYVAWMVLQYVLQDRNVRRWLGLGLSR